MTRSTAGLGIRVAIVAAMLAVPLFAASTASAVRSEFYGIAQKDLDDQDLQGMAAAKVHTVRFGLDWKLAEPSKGTFKWTGSDRLIGDLAARGIRSFPFVWASPPWVATKPSFPPTESGDEVAWQNFLKAAVGRYGPGGTYWANVYHQQHPGAGVIAYPIQAWQVWNEPNLKKYFDPGGTDAQLAPKYARLLRISQTAIKSKDPNAEIVLAGMPGYPPSGGPKAWDFLASLYQVAGIKGYFDATALHPYAKTINEFRFEISKFREVMNNNGDRRTALWLTELAWGSGPPDEFGHNVGLAGQQQLLSQSFTAILRNQNLWDVQRVFWFLWRDPDPASPFAHRCSICDTAGLLRFNRTGKPAFSTFKGFTAETTPPPVRINSGPAQGSFTNDTTPTFGFSSTEAGSSFQCHFEGQAFFPCSSPFTRAAPLSQGTHTFFVKAIDVVGNEGATASRSFTVDTAPPQTTITGGPSGTTVDRTPTFNFTSSQPGSTFQCRFDSQVFTACSGPGASHTPSTALSAGAHNFYVRAIDRAKNVDPTPASRSFTAL